MTNWENLRCFLAVAESGSLTAAASRAGASQPTLSRRIKALECELNGKLFRRMKDRYSLTPLGEVVFAQVTRMQSAVFDLERQVSGEAVQPRGRVRLATTECIASAWLVPRLGDLSRRLPEVELEILTGISMSDLMRKEADIAIRVGVSAPDPLESYRAGTVEFGLYGSAGYLESNGTPKSLAELPEHAMLESGGTLSGLPQVVQFRRSMFHEPSFAFNSILSQVEAAQQGLGLVPLPKYLTVDRPELHRVLPEAFAVRRDLWLVTHPDLLDTSRYRAVWSYLKEATLSDSSRFC